MLFAILYVKMCGWILFFLEEIVCLQLALYLFLWPAYVLVCEQQENMEVNRQINMFSYAFFVDFHEKLLLARYLTICLTKTYKIGKPSHCVETCFVLYWFRSVSTSLRSELSYKNVLFENLYHEASVLVSTDISKPVRKELQNHAPEGI